MSNNKYNDDFKREAIKLAEKLGKRAGQCLQSLRAWVLTPKISITGWKNR